MASKRRVQWLQDQITDWASEGLLPPDVERNLRARAEALRSRAGGISLFAVLGGGLIGLGIILVLGHNWAELSRAMRVALSFGLLALGQGLAAFAAFRRSGSVSWNEGAGVFSALAFVASFALVGQTYQLSGDLASFLEACWWGTTLMAIALQSRIVGVLSLLQTMAILIASLASEDPTRFHWLRLAALTPLALAMRPLPGSALGSPSLRDSILWTSLISAVGASVAIAVAILFPFGALLALAAIGVGLVALGREGPALGTGPALAGSARWIGTVGLAALAFTFTLDQPWNVVDEMASSRWTSALLGPALLVVFAAIALALKSLASRDALQREARADVRMAALMPATLLVGAGLWLGVGPGVGNDLAALLMTAYALAFGARETYKGLQEGERLRSNLGAVFLISVVALRFVSWDVSFTLRGISFIAAGVAFLLMNLHLSRRRRLEASS